jgi:molybdenum cofactor cytidylyltransferase
MPHNGLRIFTALIPAAGFSSRMGTPKLFLPCSGGKTMIEELVSGYIDFGIKQMIIVVNEMEFPEFKKRSIVFPEQVKVVINSQPELGRFRSVKIGLAQLDVPKGCFLQNIDNPFAGVEVLQSLAAHYQFNSVAMPFYKGKSGHPILIGDEIWANLLNHEKDDAIFSEQLSLYPMVNVPVPTSTILINLNKPEDYQTYIAKRSIR